MKTTTQTREARDARRKELRERWKAVKESATAGEISAADAAIATHGLKVSTTGYILALRLMRDAGLDGIPYLDTKTFNGWKSAGFSVRKGEKSIGQGITWVMCGEKEVDGEFVPSFSFPRGYALFHRSQVDETGKAKPAKKPESPVATSGKGGTKAVKAMLDEKLRTAPRAIDTITLKDVPKTYSGLADSIHVAMAGFPMVSVFAGGCSYKVRDCWESWDLMRRRLSNCGAVVRVSPEVSQKVKEVMANRYQYRYCETLGDAVRMLG